MSALISLRSRAEAARLERERASGLLAQATADYEAARAAARDAVNDGLSGRTERGAVFTAKLRAIACTLNLASAQAAERRAGGALCRGLPLRLAVRS